jgi:hypothetical protein
VMREHHTADEKHAYNFDFADYMLSRRQTSR